MSKIEATSTVVAATVYERGANIHRKSRVKLLAGENVLIYSNLPMHTFDRDTFQVSLKEGSEGVVLTGISFDEHAPLAVEEAKKGGDDSAEVEAAKKGKKIEEIGIRMKAIQQQIKELSVKKELASTKNEMVQSLFKNAVIPQTTENDPSNTVYSIANWATLLEQRAAAEKEQLLEHRKIDEAIQELEKESSLLNVQLREFGSFAHSVPVPQPVQYLQPGRAVPVPQPPSYCPPGSSPGSTLSTRFVVKVHLKSPKDVPELDLVLSYMVTPQLAGWEATYDLRAQSIKGTATLTYNAMVSQKTSEDWENVHLTLSTAKPTVSGKAPELGAWRISLAPKYTPKSASFLPSAPGASRSRNSAMYDEDVECCEEVAMGAREEAEDIRIEEAVVEPSSGGTSLNFNVAGTHTVPQSGDSIRVTLTSIGLLPQMSYTIRPKLAETAFAVMNATNPSPFALLPSSSTNVFVDGNFITRTSLPRVASKGTFRVSLGGDESIAVKYKSIKSQVSETGGLIREKKQQLSIEKHIVVKNNKLIPIDVSVEDQIPVSLDSSIEVHLTEPSYSKDTNELKKTDEGYLIWKMTIPPQNEHKWKLAFTVSHKAGDPIEGL